MPHPVIDHQGHGSFQRIAGSNGDCATGHHVQHRHGKRALSVLRDGMYDLAFRYEATYHISTFHDQGGDTVRLHQLRSSSDRRSWFDREDLGALATQNILNAHEHPPVSRRGFFLGLCLATAITPRLGELPTGQAACTPRRRVSIRYSVAKAGGSNSTIPVFSIQTSITWKPPAPRSQQ